MALVIKDALLTKNPYSRPGTKLGVLKGIVIHYVGNPNTSAMLTRNYFESLKTAKTNYASSHYIVGLNGEIIRCIPESEIAHHANAANSNFISIENCHPDATGKLNAMTYASLIELAADILRRHNATEIKRHYDVTGKMCPLYYVNNPTAWTKMVSDIRAAMLPKTSQSSVKFNFKGQTGSIPAKNENGRFITTLGKIGDSFDSERIGIRELFELLGYKVDYVNGTIVIK